MDILDASGIWISGAVVAAPPSSIEIGGEFYPMFWIAGIVIGVSPPDVVAGGDYIPTWRPRRR